MLVCLKCKTPMVGYPGEDICSDCAYPVIKQAREAAAAAMEQDHFARTGNKVPAGELIRQSLGIR